MYMYDLIQKERDRQEPLTKEELTFIVDGYTKGEIPDYQMSAFLMAVYLKGMTDRETADLTMAMAQSGEQLDLSDIPGITVDKHSSGGVGDKTSLVVAPIAASCGVPIAKMSGRGLGHTGGTVDKLESIPGFRTDISMERFRDQIRELGMALIGQTMDLAPADKKIYALRDVTATVESIPLIASSIMSKKLAAGAGGIVLDVKVGSGAFMKNTADAEVLAETMIAIGRAHGRKMTAVLSDMEQPLGNAVGNAVEVREAIDTLKGCGPQDFTELCLVLASQMILLGERASTAEEARKMAETAVSDGSALNTFVSFVTAQGGADVAADPSLLPSAEIRVPVTADGDGYVASLDAYRIGECETILGGGRLVLTDPIDHSAGVLLRKKRGDAVKRGETLAILEGNDEKKIKEAEAVLRDAYTITSDRPEARPLVIGLLS